MILLIENNFYKLYYNLRKYRILKFQKKLKKRYNKKKNVIYKNKFKYYKYIYSFYKYLNLYSYKLALDYQIDSNDLKLLLERYKKKYKKMNTLKNLNNNIQDFIKFSWLVLNGLKELGSIENIILKEKYDFFLEKNNRENNIKYFVKEFNNSNTLLLQNNEINFLLKKDNELYLIFHYYSFLKKLKKFLENYNININDLFYNNYNNYSKILQYIKLIQNYFFKLYNIDINFFYLYIFNLKSFNFNKYLENKIKQYHKKEINNLSLNHSYFRDLYYYDKIYMDNLQFIYINSFNNQNELKLKKYNYFWRKKIINNYLNLKFDNNIKYNTIINLFFLYYYKKNNLNIIYYNNYKLYKCNIQIVKWWNSVNSYFINSYFNFFTNNNLIKKYKNFNIKYSLHALHVHKKKDNQCKTFNQFYNNYKNLTVNYNDYKKNLKKL